MGINDFDKDRFDLTGYITEQAAKKDLTERERLMLYWLNELNSQPHAFFQVHDSPPEDALLDRLKLQGWIVKQAAGGQGRNSNV